MLLSVHSFDELLFVLRHYNIGKEYAFFYLAVDNFFILISYRSFILGATELNLIVIVFVFAKYWCFVVKTFLGVRVIVQSWRQLLSWVRSALLQILPILVWSLLVIWLGLWVLFKLLGE